MFEMFVRRFFSYPQARGSQNWPECLRRAPPFPAAPSASQAICVFTLVGFQGRAWGQQDLASVTTRSFPGGRALGGLCFCCGETQRMCGVSPGPRCKWAWELRAPIHLISFLLSLFQKSPAP